MKTRIRIIQRSACLMAIGLLAAGTVSTARAAVLQGQLTLRPLTPSEIKDYSLTGKQGASGLNTIGVGQPAYLDAVVNIAVAPSSIVSVTWSLPTRPIGSLAVVTTNSPLGTNVPIYKPADRLVSRVAGRATFVPDLVGQYTVTATIVTSDSGTTNVSQTITAGNYLGVQTCALCHSGGLVASNIYSSWSQTGHATFFTRAIDGLESDHYGQNCISCHTVGYDKNTNAVNGGFDDVATQVGWTFPAVLTNGNWLAMPQSLKNLANIQCENCHGPGSEHAYSLGATNKISITYNPGDCAQCHDSKPNHFRSAEWANSRHAVSTRTPSGPTRNNCVRCHTAPGFKLFLDHAGSTNTYVTNTVYEAITCAACHDPHDATNPHQLRTDNIYTLPEGTTVTNAGLGTLCMECHHSRNGSASNNVAKFRVGQPTWAGGSSFGPHDSTASDMIEGVNAITYGKFIPSGAHSYSVSNLCVGCHMQPVASTDPAFTKAGGHTFSMTYQSVVGSVTNVVDKVDVCIKCHGPITEFDMVRKDYDGDGIIDGIQTEVQHLLDKLSTMLPNSTYVPSGNYVADGLVKSSLSVKTNWQVRFMNAAWNWQFVDVEGSHGVHNAPYAVGVLKASIADLTDDADNDGLSDSWEITNFGSITAHGANEDTDGDGMNNALEMAAGTNPSLADTDGDGFSDFAELKAGSDPLNAADSPGFIVTMHGAAELEFATQVGKTYQIQAVSELSGMWQNIGPQMIGTGSLTNYLVSTRTNVQSYFRVRVQ